MNPRGSDKKRNRRIRLMRGRGMTYKKIGLKVGLSATRVSIICRYGR